MYERRRIQHCRACGAPVEYRVPDGDNRERATCTACGEIHYENPINVVGTVPVWEDQVLLCKRNIEPRRGLWTLPAGFLELGESTSEGALRETDEEAGARITLGELFTVLNVVRAGQLHLRRRTGVFDRLRRHDVELNLARHQTPAPTSRPCSLACSTDLEVGRRPTTTSTPESRRFSAWAWPWEP